MVIFKVPFHKRQVYEGMKLIHECRGLTLKPTSDSMFVFLNVYLDRKLAVSRKALFVLFYCFSLNKFMDSFCKIYYWRWQRLSTLEKGDIEVSVYYIPLKCE